jgi:hypothetical protein
MKTVGVQVVEVKEWQNENSSRGHGGASEDVWTPIETIWGGLTQRKGF